MTRSTAVVSVVALLTFKWRLWRIHHIALYASLSLSLSLSHTRFKRKGIAVNTPHSCHFSKCAIQILYAQNNFREKGLLVFFFFIEKGVFPSHHWYSSAILAIPVIRQCSKLTFIHFPSTLCNRSKWQWRQITHCSISRTSAVVSVLDLSSHLHSRLEKVLHF
jgi:hypothetical protein